MDEFDKHMLNEIKWNDRLIIIVLCIFLTFFLGLAMIISCSTKSNEKATAIKSESYITYEQAMRWDEICEFHAERGDYLSKKACLADERSRTWWKAVNLDSLDRNYPYRIKYCERKNACWYQYGELE